MKLGHISDLHIFALDKLRPRRFLNKRLIGGANLLANRSKAHSPEVVRAALTKLTEYDVDHIAITGDLTNLALDEEFEAAADIIGRLPDALKRVSVVPGNHDYYVPEVVERRPFERVFAPYLTSDLPTYQLETGYPFCKLLGEDIALIGLNTGHPSPPMFATGEVDARELRACEGLLQDPKVRDRFTVVMLHHPLLPFEHSSVEFTRRLINAEDVLGVLRQRNVDLAIHGHNHYYHSLALPHLGAPGTLRICEAGSTSVAAAKDPMYAGKFNIYHIEDGVLEAIETHIFDAEAASFSLWREQTFVEEIEPESASRAAHGGADLVATEEEAMTTWPELARPLGLKVDEDAFTITRHEVTQPLDPGLKNVDLNAAEGRALAAAELEAHRLSIDTMLAEWTSERERDELPDKVYQKYEIPSVHGERMPRVVPTQTLLRLEALLEQRCISTEAPVDNLSVVYVLEVGKHLHVMTRRTLEQTAMSSTKLRRDAQSALFYQSYKVRPAEERTYDGTRVRIYRTREGLAAARLTLLPDFDYNAALARGVGAVASRQEMIVVEPSPSGDRERAIAVAEQVLEELRDEATHPIIAPWLPLDPQGDGDTAAASAGEEE